MPENLANPIIVCPLAFEEQILRKCEVPGRLICSGPKSQGIGRLSALIGDEPRGPVILAGVAAALDQGMPVGSAWLASAVVGASGLRWRPNWPVTDQRDAKHFAVIACSDHVLSSPQAKRRFAAALAAVEDRAQLVDQESEAFAQLASERGWTWGIARGVSDGLDDAMPSGVEAWVDEQGRTRLSRVMSAIATRPTELAALMSLRRNTLRALRSLATLLKSRIC